MFGKLSTFQYTVFLKGSKEEYHHRKVTVRDNRPEFHPILLAITMPITFNFSRSETGAPPKGNEREICANKISQSNFSKGRILERKMYKFSRWLDGWIDGLGWDEMEWKWK